VYPGPLVYEWEPEFLLGRSYPLTVPAGFVLRTPLALYYGQSCDRWIAAMDANGPLIAVTPTHISTGHRIADGAGFGLVPPPRAAEELRRPAVSFVSLALQNRSPPEALFTAFADVFGFSVLTDGNVLAMLALAALNSDVFVAISVVLNARWSDAKFFGNHRRGPYQDEAAQGGSG
jgi:hypothetical protein